MSIDLFSDSFNNLSSSESSDQMSSSSKGLSGQVKNTNLLSRAIGSDNISDFVRLDPKDITICADIDDSESSDIDESESVSQTFSITSESSFDAEALEAANKISQVAAKRLNCRSKSSTDLKLEGVNHPMNTQNCRSVSSEILESATET